MEGVSVIRFPLNKKNTKYISLKKINSKKAYFEILSKDKTGKEVREFGGFASKKNLAVFMRLAIFNDDIIKYFFIKETIGVVERKKLLFVLEELRDYLTQKDRENISLFFTLLGMSGESKNERKKIEKFIREN